jgi:very-short-patch-repair endonuclease
MRRYDGGAIDVTTPRKWRSAKGIRRHCSRLLVDEVTTVDGIAVTGVSRTILDLAANAPAHVVEIALREAEYIRLDDSLSLPRLLDRYPGRRGVRAVRVALARCAESPGRTRSGLEERFLPFLDRYRLPRPQLNVWVEVRDERHQVDCLWPQQKAIVELDGWQAHGTRRAFREDRARDRRLRAAGYAVTRITWSQLDDEAEAVAMDLRESVRASPR